MPPQKRHSATRRRSTATKGPAKTKKRTPPGRSKTQALAMTDAVRRGEPLVRARPTNPLAVFEPLRKAVIDRQIALIDMAITWSPAHVIVSQQAAFWEGFAHDGAKVGGRRRSAARPARRRKTKA